MDLEEKKNIYFETVKSVGVGTVLAVSIAAASSVLRNSRTAKKLSLPSLDDLNQLLGDTTTLAAGAAFGYCGLRDTIRHNREVERTRIKERCDSADKAGWAASI